MTKQQAIARFIEIDPAFEHRHEILREITISAFMRGYEEGYEAGFEVARVAERGIQQAQSRFDQIDDLGETIIQTYEILKPLKP